MVKPVSSMSWLVLFYRVPKMAVISVLSGASAAGLARTEASRNSMSDAVASVLLSVASASVASVVATASVAVVVSSFAQAVRDSASAPAPRAVRTRRFRGSPFLARAVAQGWWRRRFRRASREGVVEHRGAEVPGCPWGADLVGMLPSQSAG
ncbi:hypothetical protein A0K93_00930 [Corynebacterium sp. BCW_4722]|nr:hypothetical protein A0K93_00930 [Corynebacterium sp. BCW_4722]